MALIRIIKDWQTPDLLRQTPGGRGEWGGHTFTTQPVDACDYAIILNRVPSTLTLNCPPENIWLIVQEPPVALYRWFRKGFEQPARVYTPDAALRKPKFIHSHGALPWHVDKTYDELKNQPPVEKTRPLSWITSNTSVLPGHKKRMRFREHLEKEVEFDHWGRGFTPIAEKWDGLAPYRYSLAIENHRCERYWTEKIADCFLSRTMPIYDGATDLARYFPEESFIRIDLNDRSAIRQIKAILSSDLWRTRRDAVEHARNLVLERHQFFPFVTEQIDADQARQSTLTPREITLYGLPDFSAYYRDNNLPTRLWSGLRRRLKF